MNAEALPLNSAGLPLMPPTVQAAGWFGKMAALGDFSARRLPPEFVSRCDNWLSRCVQTSQQQLGERWLSTYLTAPIWRFAWSPGIAGAQWWMGVLMPSVDNVGRYFPLVIAQSCPYAPDSGQDQTALQRWMDHVTQAAIATLQPGLGVDAFEAQLASAPIWQAAPPNNGARMQRLVGRDRFDGVAHPSLSHWLECVADESLHNQVQGQSIWWLPDNGHGGGNLSIGPGLPAPDHFIELLQGSW
jgi:type VI secretion system protein ImpM